MRPDLVLCLAVVHHLALTNNVPLDEIVALLADFGAPLVVEFPHRDDPMATRLLARKRSGLFDAYDVAELGGRRCEQRFADRASSEVLPSGTRTLYRCTPDGWSVHGRLAATGCSVTSSPSAADLVDATSLLPGLGRRRRGSR